MKGLNFYTESRQRPGINFLDLKETTKKISRQDDLVEKNLFYTN